MYNMDISIGSYKFRIEVIVLIIVVLWILWGHLLFSCSTVGLKEGFDMAKKVPSESTWYFKSLMRVKNGVADERRIRKANR